MTVKHVEVVTEPGKGRQPLPLAREVEKAKVRKQRKRDQVARWITEEKMSHAQVAGRMGISTRWVGQLWRESVVAASSEGLSDAEVRKEVRIKVTAALERVMEVGIEKVEETAAYGSAVVSASKTLLEMHGATEPQALADTDQRARLAELEERMRNSPVIRKRLAQLQRIKDNEKRAADDMED